MPRTLRAARARTARISRVVRGIRVGDHLTIDPAQRNVAVLVSGALWLVGGVTLFAYPLLPGAAQEHLATVIALGAASVTWGACSLLMVPWGRAAAVLVQLATAVAVAAVAVAVSVTGGSQSSAWIYFFWVVLFAAYFYEQPVAIAYIVACIVVQALPFAYDARALHDGFFAQLIAASGGFVTIGVAVTTGKTLLMRVRIRAEMVAAEQAALRRVATAVVGGEQPGAIFALAAREVAPLLGASGACVLAFRPDGRTVIAGAWSAGQPELPAADEPFTLTPGGGIQRAVFTRAVVRFDEPLPPPLAQVLGAGPAVAGPIIVAGSVWGVVAASSPATGPSSGTGAQRLAAFCSLLSTAVANLEERARLAAEALTDPLTGLCNQRALQQRLADELAGADRHGRTVSVAILDLDRFKEINDTAGHAAGDAVLRQLAEVLESVARGGDTIGRLGGDEFMWIMPDTGAGAARIAVERARELVSRTIVEPLPVTTSAGICDTTTTIDAAELLRFADVALYASKAEGRNQVTVHAAPLAVALSGSAEQRPADRDQALGGLRALARAIDAKDPATREHSERVAALVGNLARSVGWPEERIALLRDAALVHDVGKLAVPDALLTKPGTLTARERVQMSEHAELSARIVGSVLSAEQVGWIRYHHERPDGGGYPLGVRAERIPEGAALIALADAFDVMTAGRTYSVRRSVREAVDECAALAGHQFTAEAVAALFALDAAGDLELDRGPELLVALGR